MSGKNEGANKPKMTRAVQDRIGRELREMYAELLKQPLPENLVAPLRAPDEPTARQRLEDALSVMRGENGTIGASSSQVVPPPPDVPEAKSA
jgi:hypothetical protein